MSKQKYYYYILVFTDNGPIFVTSEDYSTKIVHWNKLEKPKLYSKESARDVVLGLTLNFFTAFVIESQYEIESQIYYYDKYELKFIEIEE